MDLHGRAFVRNRRTNCPGLEADSKAFVVGISWLHYNEAGKGGVAGGGLPALVLVFLHQWLPQTFACMFRDMALEVLPYVIGGPASVLAHRRRSFTPRWSDK